MKKIVSVLVITTILLTQLIGVHFASYNAQSAQIIGMQDFESESIRGANYKKYSTSSQSGLLDGEWYPGGSEAPKANVNSVNVHGGSYALSYTERDRDNARIKIAHILPDSIESYLGKTIIIKGYIMLSNYTDSSKTAGILLSVMSDLDYNTRFAKISVTANIDTWTEVSVKLNVTNDCIVKNSSGSITYPLRVAVETEGGAIPKSIYIDDFTAEIDASALTSTSAFQGFETNNTAGVDYNTAGLGSTQVSLCSDLKYVKSGEYSVKTENRTDLSGGLRVLNLLENILKEENVGKTFKITAYVMPWYEKDESTSDEVYHKNLSNLNFSMVLTKPNSAEGTSRICKTGLKNKEWNKMTILFPVTTSNVAGGYNSLRIDQDTSLIASFSTFLCTDFYTDDILVELYSDFYNTVNPVFEYEDYESKDSFTQYGTTSYESLLNGDYRLGGDGATPTVEISSIQHHTGNKSLRVSGLGPRSNGNFGSRTKLANLLPSDLENYIGYTFKFSAYVMAENYSGTNADTDDKSFSTGFITDKNTTLFNAQSYYLPEGEWKLMQSEIEITSDFVNSILYSGSDKLDNETRVWPLRPYIQFGGNTKIPSTVYIDDITVEYSYENDDISITLPKMFADNMVIQRNKPIPIWGWNGNPGDVITAKIDSIQTSGTVDENGNLYMELPAMIGGKNKTLIITNGESKKIFANVGIGEVWYCSGQSNMELKVASIFNKESIINIANDHDVRSLYIPKAASYSVQRDIPSNSQWKIVNSSNVSGVSAIAYIAAYQIEEYLGVPVAIIECYDGGSSAQAWLSYGKIFAADRANVYNNDDWRPLNSDGSTNNWGCSGRTIIEDYEFYKDIYKEGTNSRYTPTAYYNGMQAPLAPYPIAGVMWYQGESQPNARLAEQYNYILYDLINQWREDFNDENLPVMLVQLAPYSAETGRNFFEIRQAQLDTSKRMNNVGVIATANEGPIGTANGDTDSIHPKTKIPVGNRMAATINAMVYGKPDEYCGPEYESMTIDGNKAVLSFSHLAEGLKIKDGDTSLRGFKISYDGTTFTDATANIVGDKIEVYTSETKSPVAVSYCYVNISTAYTGTLGGNLENSLGYPAFPFIATLSKPSFDSVTVYSSQNLAAINTPVISDLQTGVKVKASIKETGFNNSSQRVIGALYENGNLVEARVGETSFVTRDKKTVDFDFRHSALGSSKYEIKIFLWDSSNSLNPLSLPNEIEFK